MTTLSDDDDRDDDDDDDDDDNHKVTTDNTITMTVAGDTVSVCIVLLRGWSRREDGVIGERDDCLQLSDPLPPSSDRYRVSPTRRRRFKNIAALRRGRRSLYMCLARARKLQLIIRNSCVL